MSTRDDEAPQTERRGDIPPTEALAVIEPPPITLRSHRSEELVLVGGATQGAPKDPRAVYLAGLTTAGSRAAMAGAFDRIARALSELAGRPIEAERVPWHRLRYSHTSAIRAWLIEHHAYSTVNHSLSALRGVLRESARLGLISLEDMTSAIDMKPARGSRLPAGRSLSLAEVRALVAVCDRATPGGARDAAMIGVLFNCGLRRAELVELNLADYNRAQHSLVVRGKGNKERTGYVTAAVELLDAWLDVRGDEPGPLFVHVDHTRHVKMRRLTDEAVRFVLKRVGDRASVAAFSPHDMRRTFISDLLEHTDISIVQKLAGHAGVTTTQRYDRRGDDAKRKAAERIRL